MNNGTAAFCAAVALGAALPALLQGAPPNAKAKKTTELPLNLVWPGPPERPRIRYVSMIRGAEDVSGRSRQSFVERLSGKSQAREQLRLNKPYGVAVDGAGTIYIADPAQRGVLVFDREARAASLRRGNAQFPLFMPIAVALDPAGRMFVSDSFASQVVVFEASGRPVAAFGKGTLQRPGGLTVDPERNRVWVTDAKRNELLAFDAASYKLLKTVGGTSKSGEFEPGTFSGPTNVTLDIKGRLYVSDTWNCRVQVFDPEGRFLRTFGSHGDRPGRFVRPKGIAVDSEGHVYVADAGFNNFQIFTPEGKPLMFVGSAGDDPGQFLLPTGMAIDKQDRIYVVEQRPEGSRLQIFQYLPEKSGLPPGGED